MFFSKAIVIMRRFGPGFDPNEQKKLKIAQTKTFYYFFCSYSSDLFHTETEFLPGAGAA
jgi:hypothetical protein